MEGTEGRLLNAECLWLGRRKETGTTNVLKFTADEDHINAFFMQTATHANFVFSARSEFHMHMVRRSIENTVVGEKHLASVNGFCHDRVWSTKPNETHHP